MVISLMSSHVVTWGWCTKLFIDGEASIWPNYLTFPAKFLPSYVQAGRTTCRFVGPAHRLLCFGVVKFHWSSSFTLSCL